MTNYVFNTGIPAANNNPSTDQPDMLTNNISANAIMNVDHFTFNNNNGGMHQQVQIVSQNTIPAPANNTPPAMLKAGTGNLYSKPLGGPSDLFFTPDQSGNEYQLTRVDAVGFARFGTFTVDGIPADPLTISTFGWTFLPGGLLMQYGTVTGLGVSNLPNTAIVNFPKAFTTGVFSINISIRRNDPTNNFLSLTRTPAPSTTSFTYVITSGSADALYWQAIGK